MANILASSFRTVSFQKVVKPELQTHFLSGRFRTVSFQKVVKPVFNKLMLECRFRTVSFQKVVKLLAVSESMSRVLELYHFRR